MWVWVCDIMEILAACGGGASTSQNWPLVFVVVLSLFLAVDVGITAYVVFLRSAFGTRTSER